MASVAAASAAQLADGSEDWPPKLSTYGFGRLEGSMQLERCCDPTERDRALVDRQPLCTVDVL